MLLVCYYVHGPITTTSATALYFEQSRTTCNRGVYPVPMAQLSRDQFGEYSWKMEI